MAFLGHDLVQALPRNTAGTPTLGATPILNNPAPVGPQPITGAPPTGLIGSEQAIMGGFNGAIDELNGGTRWATDILGQSYGQAQGSANPAVTLGAGSTDPLNQAAGNFTGYMDAGTAASKLQSDLLGVNGAEAQIAAQQNDPATDYLMAQAIKGRERSAAARGGLFSGNTGLELNRDLAGILSQGQQQRINNLGNVASQGLSAASQVGGLKSTEAQLAGNIQSQGIGNDAALLQQKNSIQANIMDRIAEIQNASGQNKALLYSQTGQQLGSGRTNAGLAIAQNASNTASSISQLLKEQGVGISDSMAADITTVSNLLHEAGLQDSIDAKNLAQILANISTGSASNIQQGYENVGNAQAAGILGTNKAIQNGLDQAISLGAFGSFSQQPPPPVSAQVGTGQQYANLS
jgi:hypothetical protein